MASLKEIRARIAAQENKSNKTFTPGEGAIYPHWNIDEGSTAVVRFLEDGNVDNPDFWVERAMFKFVFNGVKGDPTAGSNIVVQVPCMEMYGEKDAILDEVRTWFKDPTMEDMGRKYWKKRSYLYQGFVHADPMDEKGPENPIRRFMISPQIHTIIKAGLMDPELENLPTGHDDGLDLRINKHEKGGYADYTTSSWARKETSLTEEELEAISEHGLSDLASFLPAKPTEEVQKVIREMFEASVDGEPYDIERWGAYYTPAGMNRTGGNTELAAKAAAKAATSKESTDESKKAIDVDVKAEEAEEAEEVKDDVITDNADAEKSDKTDKAQSILAMIRSRQS